MSLPLLAFLGDVDLTQLIVEQRVGRVVIADVEVDGDRLLEVLRDCKKMSVKVSLLPSTFSALGPSVEVDDVQGVTVLESTRTVLSRSSRMAKRALDLVGAGLLSVFAIPFVVVLALAIKLDSRVPCCSASSASAAAATASVC